MARILARGKRYICVSWFRSSSRNSSIPVSTCRERERESVCVRMQRESVCVCVLERERVRVC